MTTEDSKIVVTEQDKLNVFDFIKVIYEMNTNEAPLSIKNILLEGKEIKSNDLSEIIKFAPDHVILRMLECKRQVDLALSRPMFLFVCTLNTDPDEQENTDEQEN